VFAYPRLSAFIRGHEFLVFRHPTTRGPAAAPEAQAHWKLKPPNWPVTSTTSPIEVVEKQIQPRINTDEHG
jgi:hypothetical protein